ncbi:tRNA1(Val) (adenine(37)-N6)-methyltransferase [Carboxylicivirga caseinilyticus]|uniref:tRNA1(Val) (adenine(37)-N6)-methyltransferase n=1 Tax=Carboxylicivirga caseinilyticus TaxID=3417572 RepID=UPI003D33F240|nr:tRNA (adenine(22)-N(1))-methyltransferase TrmK [Marinilabiliaceae bacterium A049]
MANNYFQFKQFRINQDKAAMKVGTDGVLLGAWAAIENAQTILDVGTGTGLIALMAAQRNTSAEIIAIDIDENACEQAYENVQCSPWSDRITVIHSSIQDFASTNENIFDYIVSNPPFFNKSLKSENTARNLARHTDSLSYEELFHCSIQLSSPAATLGLIIPHLLEKEIISIKNYYDYNLSRILRVKGDINKQIVRSLLEFNLGKATNFNEEIIYIEKGKRHAYSEEYKALTRDFYLTF